MSQPDVRDIIAARMYFDRVYDHLTTLTGAMKRANPEFNLQVHQLGSTNDQILIAVHTAYKAATPQTVQLLRLDDSLGFVVWWKSNMRDTRCKLSSNGTTYFTRDGRLLDASWLWSTYGDAQADAEQVLTWATELLNGQLGTFNVCNTCQYQLLCLDRMAMP